MKAKIKILKEFEIKYLDVKAHMDYWDGANVNGVEEQEDNPTIPFSDKETRYWRIRIDVDNGHIENWPEGVTAEVYYKVCDEGVYTLLDEDENEIVRSESYVPGCFGITNSGYGDYMFFNIDRNGYIENWSFCEDDVDKIIKNDFNYEED